MSGLYIHVPFCKGKCLYCDFYSAGVKSEWIHRFADAVVNEYRQRRDEIGAVDTIYFGGGTPSLLPADLFAEIADKICNDARNKVPGNDSEKPREITEFTIEVNPEDITAPDAEEKISVWKRYGVNRVSMGVQSFSDCDLSRLRRRHNSKTALDAYTILHEHFDNISLDLMYGLPGQTIAGWRSNVEKAIDLKPRHISAYSLMYEPRTALTLLRDTGKIKELHEDTVVEMFLLLGKMLRDAGFEQYEVSNFALPGYLSRHNHSYWTGEPYLGLGPAAHSFDGGFVRRSNPADIRRYLDHFSSETTAHDHTPYYIEEKLSLEERREETVMLMLRTAEGIDLEEYGQKFGESALKRLLDRAMRQIDQCLMQITEGRLQLSSDGIMQSDAIILDLES